MRKFIPIITGLLLVFIALWWETTSVKLIHSFNERIRNISYDIQLENRLFIRPPAISPNIVIVDIDDKSVKIEGRWPWNRRKIADLITRIQKQNPLAIVLDLIAAEKQENIAETVLKAVKNNPKYNSACTTELSKTLNLFEEDALLARAISTSSVYLPFIFLPNTLKENTLPSPLQSLTKDELDGINFFKASGYICNLDIFQSASKGGGFINAAPDSDGVFRRSAVIGEYNNNLYSSLSLFTISSIFGDKVKLKTVKYGEKIKLEGVNVGDGFISTDDRGYAFIPYVGESHTFPYFAATDILHDNVRPDAFFGKIVLIGMTATSQSDLHPTPVGPTFPGVEIEATLLNGVLLNGFATIPAWFYVANLFLTFLIGILSVFVFPRLGPRLLAIIIIFFPALLLLASSWIWIESGYIFYVTDLIFIVVSIAILNAIYSYFFETRKREYLESIFGQYVSENHIDEMLKSESSQLILHSEDRVMTVLFADIRDFTTISESMPASEVVAILNAFFTALSEVILKYDGTIDKYVGDEIIAFWGAPLVDQHHVANSLAAALEMQAATRKLNEAGSLPGHTKIQIGVGINTGTMSIGDMGSRYRRNYTVLGDSVNLAARVESLTKLYGVEIMVTEYTQANHPEFIFRKLDKVRVKGKKISVVIYELICKRDALTNEVQDELNLFDKGLNHYFAQQWDEAIRDFKQLLEKKPNIRLYQLFLKRSEDFKSNPPPENWDGIYESTLS